MFNTSHSVAETASLKNGQRTAPSRKARNRAALFSNDNASARTVGLIAAFSMALRKMSGAYCDLRLFHKVFRFCPNDSFRKLMKSSSGTCRVSNRRVRLRRTTAECTLGGGEKADGSNVN